MTHSSWLIGGELNSRTVNDGVGGGGQPQVHVVPWSEVARRYQGNRAVEGATLIGTVPFGQGSLLMPLLGPKAEFDRVGVNQEGKKRHPIRLPPHRSLYLARGSKAYTRRILLPSTGGQ